MTIATELAEDGLFRRILAGDEEAFALLYRSKHPAIYRYALHMSGNPAVAEDVTQEAFMTLIRDAKRFDPQRGTIGAYLFGVARNHLRKRWAQDRQAVPLPDGEDDLNVLLAGSHAPSNGNGNGTRHGHDEFESVETSSRVRQAIATLPENYREVVVLCELEEMNYEEAASALECPVGTVRSRLHRARVLLLEKLREAQRPAVRRASVAGGGHENDR
jgi:RNA polymerase sigma-70 factor (ECF subfamily)